MRPSVNVGGRFARRRHAAIGDPGGLTINGSRRPGEVGKEQLANHPCFGWLFVGVGRWGG